MEEQIEVKVAIDADAKAKVFRLAHDMGVRPVDVGPLKAAHDLDRLSA